VRGCEGGGTVKHIVYVTKTEFADPDGDEELEEALYEHAYQEATNLREADWILDGLRLEIEGA